MNIPKLFVFVLVSVAFTALAYRHKSPGLSELKDGDIIFHTSLSAQSKAIALATHSKYTHCGIIFNKGDSVYVLEAVQPVKLTPVQEWINRCKDRAYTIKRLKDANRLLNDTVKAKMKRTGKDFLGRPYDLYFGWGDEKIYCSELVWKIYDRGAGIKLCNLQNLHDFDLSNPLVKKKMAERYGNPIPLTEKVVSPSALYQSDLLETIY